MNFYSGFNFKLLMLCIAVSLTKTEKKGLERKQNLIEEVGLLVLWLI